VAHVEDTSCSRLSKYSAPLLVSLPTCQTQATSGPHGSRPLKLAPGQGSRMSELGFENKVRGDRDFDGPRGLSLG
jgi:hypothetical protein